METQSKTSAKDFFINLGAVVALYVSVVNLVNLLFRVINRAYPQINEGSYYGFWGSESISWPVAALLVFCPIFILLMWLLEQDYKLYPEKQYMGIHKWLAYITLFVFGLVLAGDLLAVLYYFIDGRELTAGFLLKVVALLIIAGTLFSYYLFDVRGKLTGNMRKIYRIIALVIVLGSIIWGFAVLGSPRTQKLYKYDMEKIDHLANINDQVGRFYELNLTLPENMEEINSQDYYVPNRSDSQTGKPYEYIKTGDRTYELCAEFNKASDEKTESMRPYGPYYGDINWTHPAGRYCFKQALNPNMYPKTMPLYLEP